MKRDVTENLLRSLGPLERDNTIDTIDFSMNCLETDHLGNKVFSVLLTQLQDGSKTIGVDPLIEFGQHSDVLLRRCESECNRHDVS